MLCFAPSAISWSAVRICFIIHISRRAPRAHQLFNSRRPASLASFAFVYSRKPLSDSLASRALEGKASSGVLPRRVSPASSNLSDRVCTQRACSRHIVSAKPICARLVSPNAPRIDRGRKQQTSNTHCVSLPPRAHHPTTSQPHEPGDVAQSDDLMPRVLTCRQAAGTRSHPGKPTFFLTPFHQHTHPSIHKPKSILAASQNTELAAMMIYELVWSVGFRLRFWEAQPAFTRGLSSSSRGEELMQ